MDKLEEPAVGDSELNTLLFRDFKHANHTALLAQTGESVMADLVGQEAVRVGLVNAWPSPSSSLQLQITMHLVLICLHGTSSRWQLSNPWEAARAVLDGSQKMWTSVEQPRCRPFSSLCEDLVASSLPQSYRSTEPWLYLRCCMAVRCGCSRKLKNTRLRFLILIVSVSCFI